MTFRATYRAISAYAAIGAMLSLVALLVATIYFTWFDLPWIAFLGGILSAAILAIVSRVTRAEWIVARRNAQLAKLRDRLAAESARRSIVEKALSAAQRELRFLDEDLPVMAAYVDTECALRYHNRAFREMHGHRLEGVQGRHLRDVVGEKAWVEIWPFVSQALEGRASQSVRSAEDPAGSPVRLSLQCIPHIGESGRMAGMFLLQARVAEHSEYPTAPHAPLGASGSRKPIFEEPAGTEPTGWGNVGDRLRSAMANDEFCLYFQRIKPVTPAPGQRPFCELLLRLREEEENMMPPGSFLPLAEKHGLMPEVDRWVVRRLLDWVGARDDRRVATYCVNVAPSTIAESQFPAFLAGEFDRRGLAPSLLCIEIAESDAFRLRGETARFVEALAKSGVRITLCGFGSSAESLELMKSLAVDFLKIDGDLVLRAVRSTADAARIGALVGVAKVLRRSTIAEFVESEESLALLRILGVDFAQGFGISRPRPLGDLTF